MRSCASRLYSSKNIILSIPVDFWFSCWYYEHFSWWAPRSVRGMVITMLSLPVRRWRGTTRRYLYSRRNWYKLFQLTLAPLNLTGAEELRDYGFQSSSRKKTLPCTQIGSVPTGNSSSCSPNATEFPYLGRWVRSSNKRLARSTTLSLLFYIRCKWKVKVCCLYEWWS